MDSNALIIFLLFYQLQIYQRLSEEAGNGVEETQDMCISFLQQFKKYLSMVCHASADEMEKVQDLIPI